MTQIWKQYGVDLQVTNEFMAGIPKNPELIKTWLESRKPSDVRLAKKEAAGEAVTPLPELAEKVAEEVDNEGQEEEKIWLGFKQESAEETGNAEGCRRYYIDGSNIKAHLKDCANVLKELLDLRAFRSKLADRVYVKEERIWLGDALSGTHEHPVHVMTRQGPRTALKRNDFINRPRLEFTLKVLADDVISEDLLRDLFEYGAVHGIGAERGLGYGRYMLEKLEEVS